MSGEATTRSAAGAGALERAFGDAAACNRCGERVADYRVIAVFLHETGAVRAYCRGCYTVAVEGEYHARGDGLVLDYPTYSARFGSPGPAPPPTTPVDRFLATLVRDPGLLTLVPPSEATARRQGKAPYRFRVGLRVGGKERNASLALSAEGAIEKLEGDEEARVFISRIANA